MLKDYAEILEKTIPDAVHLNARLVCVEFARRTQPFGGEESKLQGEKAIATDIYGGRRSSNKGKGRAGVFQNITPLMESYAEHISSSAMMRVFAKKDGTVYGIDRAHFLPDASVSDIREIHKTRFVKGKMSSAGRESPDIGRWKFINKFFVPKSSLDQFIAAQYAKVGTAKAAWAYCATQLKKVVSGNMMRDIPNYVQKIAKDHGRGKVEDLTSDKKKPRVILTSNVNYASEVLRTTEQFQGLSIVGDKMKKQMETILKKRQLKLKETA